jgi:hypothetical protein
MKKLCLLLVCASASIALAYGQKTVRVSNVEEFLNALASNVVIEAQAGKYDVSDFTEMSGSSYSYERVYDGKELVITGLQNLTIKGKGVEFVTKPAYGNVFFFKNCDKITIEGITAGHSPDKGSCVGGVLKFLDTPSVTISNCKLYGSGIEGITAENVSNLTCKNTDIYECTYGLLTLVKVKNATFEKCTLRDSKEFDLINISNSGNVTFKDCKITGNQTGVESFTDYALFNVSNTTKVTVEKCLIENNVAQYFSKDKKAVVVKSTTLNKNQFKKAQ